MASGRIGNVLYKYFYIAKLTVLSWSIDLDGKTNEDFSLYR